MLEQRQQPTAEPSRAAFLSDLEQIDTETRGGRTRTRRLRGREAASMPIQKRLLELHLERSGALRESPGPAQFSALSLRPPRPSAPISGSCNAQCAARSSSVQLP